jgi:CheY-specific phosphatase CheX
MFVDNNSVQNEVAALASEACVALFSAYNVVLARTTANIAKTENPMISSVMGFVGPDIRGTLLLTADHGPLLATRPCEGRLRDWAGELANQLVGQLKAKLLARGTDLALTTPVVLQGLRLEPLPKHEAEPAIFSGANGMVLVWVEVETVAGFELQAEGPSQTAAMGDIQVF